MIRRGHFWAISLGHRIFNCRGELSSLALIASLSMAAYLWAITTDISRIELACFSLEEPGLNLLI